MNKRPKRGRPPLANPMVHTAVVLPRKLLERLHADAALAGRGVSTEIRERLFASVLGQPAWVNQTIGTASIVLVGDIINGFEAWGPFDSGHDAIAWKQSTGVREFTQGQWYLMTLKEPKMGGD